MLLQIIADDLGGNMNERIKQLIIDARDAFTNGVTETNGEVYIHGSEENLEKFANLIIQECLDIAKKNTYGPYDIPMTPATRRAWYIRIQIKKHFGISFD